MEPRAMWIRVKGCTVYAFPPKVTGSQLEGAKYQAGFFRGDGTGRVAAVAFHFFAAGTHLGWFGTAREAVAAILNHHRIAPTDESVGIPENH